MAPAKIDAADRYRGLRLLAGCEDPRATRSCNCGAEIMPGNIRRRSHLGALLKLQMAQLRILRTPSRISLFTYHTRNLHTAYETQLEAIYLAGLPRPRALASAR